MCLTLECTQGLHPLVPSESRVPESNAQSQQQLDAAMEGPSTPVKKQPSKDKTAGLAEIWVPPQTPIHSLSDFPPESILDQVYAAEVLNPGKSGGRGVYAAEVLNPGKSGGRGVKPFVYSTSLLGLALSRLSQYTSIM